MMTENPFASPQSESLPPPKSPAEVGPPYGRHGPLLVVPSRCELPPRCIICNTTEEVFKERYNFEYYPSRAWILLAIPPMFLGCMGVMLGVVGILVVLLLIQRKARVVAYVCRQHETRSRAYSIISGLFVAIVAGAVGLVLFTPYSAGAFTVVSLVIWFLATFFILSRTRPLRAEVIDQHGIAFLRGCQEPFLQTFAEAQIPEAAPPDAQP